MRRSIRISIHIAYWLAVLAFYFLYFGERPGPSLPNLLFAVLLLPVTIGTTYFILYRLIPRFLLQRRYFRFGLYVAYTLVISLYLELVIVVSLYMTVSDYQAMVVSPDFPSLTDAILGMYLFVSVAVVAHLTRVQSQSALRLKEAELALLRSQLQPHFLFNALNSLYALALESREETPEHILRLSTILDYVLYKAEQESVALKEEIKMVRAYVELESVRCGDRVDVSLDADPSGGDRRIAPLLILPLVENAFKHGVHPTTKKSRIDVVIANEDDGIRVQVSNTVPPDRKTSPGGTGLSNLRQRLAILYPGDHSLQVSRGDDAFSVDLYLHSDPEES